MSHTNSVASFLLALVNSVAVALAQEVEMKPPEVGDLAPEIGPVYWVQQDKGEHDMAKLRGKVVLVTSYGYYCDSCVRTGVPLAKALRDAYPEDLRVIALTVGIGDDTPETIVAEAKKLGIVSSIAQVGANGDSSPYVNLGVNSNLTYAFVISRSGAVTWRGDPSREKTEYLAAVSNALLAPPAKALPNECATELREAVRAYACGEWSLVEPAVQNAVKKFGSKVPRVKKDGEVLLGLLEESRKVVMDDLEMGAGGKEIERYVRAADHIRRAYPKGPNAERLGQLEMHMYMQSDAGTLCKQWCEWIELERARPAAFPLIKDKEGTKFSKVLAKYVKDGTGVGVERAKGWLQLYPGAFEMK